MNDLSTFYSQLLDELKNLRILHQQEPAAGPKGESPCGGLGPGSSKADELDRTKPRRHKSHSKPADRREASRPRREEAKRTSTVDAAHEPDGWEKPDGSLFAPPEDPTAPGHLCWADDESSASLRRDRDSGVTSEDENAGDGAPTTVPDTKDSVAAAEAEWAALKRQLDDAYDATRELDDRTHRLFTRAASFKRQYPEDAPRLIGCLDRDLFDWQGEVAAKYAFRRRRTRFRELQARNSCSAEKMMAKALRRLKEARARHQKVTEEIESLERTEREVEEKIRRLREVQLPQRRRSKSSNNKQRPAPRPAEDE